MVTKAFWTSTEALLGVGMIIAGLCAQIGGMHDIFTQALAPFGAGLILSEGVSRTVKATRKRAKVRIRRDDQD